MSLPITRDELTNVPVSRVTSGEGIHLLPYYTANALSSDGRFLCCSYDKGGTTQAWLYSMETGEGRPISDLKEGILQESVAFHPTKPWFFYASRAAVYFHDLETGDTNELFRCSDKFCVKSEISVGKKHMVFQIYEIMDCGRDGSGRRIGHFSINCRRSYVISVQIESGSSTAIRGDTAPLAHPVVSPVDDSIVLFANQGNRERLQELFIVPVRERDNRHPLKLYHATDQRPIYVGHSFFTLDGWVGTQLIEFGCKMPDGSRDRRVRCPGGNKPLHSHAAYADSWWVGDAHPEEGRCDSKMLTIMKNNWETGYCQAEPLAVHGCDHERPCHVHARFTPDEKRVLFNSNCTGDCHVYVAHVEEFLANWKDRAPFEKRAARYCYSHLIERNGPTP